MRRAFRGFAIASAVLMTLVAVATYSHQGQFGPDAWLLWLYPPLCYLVLAIGSGSARHVSEWARPWWLSLLFVASLSPAGALALGSNPPYSRFLLVGVILYLVLTAFFLRRLRPGGMVSPAGTSRILLPLLFCVGAGLVVSSLFLAITFHDSGTKSLPACPPALTISSQLWSCSR